ncbi:MAG: NAD(P)H-binding protein [Spirochaetia bacterium]|jgi:putative NADH-flavin reductase
MSTVAVLGAAGRTGRIFVQEAVRRGYAVKALVRNVNARQDFPPGVTVIQGDATDESSLQQLIEGVDVVVSLLGQAKGSSSDLKVKSTRLSLSIMQRKGVKRFLRLASAPFGVPGEGDDPTGGQKFLVGLVKFFAGSVVNDERKASEDVRHSSVEWTLVRAPILTDTPYPGKYQVGSLGRKSGRRVSRATIAQFILDEIENRGHIRKSPLVTD